MNQHIPTLPPADADGSPAPVTPVNARRGTPVWKQLLLCIVVLGLAFAGWYWFYPGAPQMLAQNGIVLPIAPPAATTAETPAARGPGQAGPGAGAAGGPPGGGRGGFARATPVVVVQPVGVATINDRLSAVGEGTAARSVSVVTPVAGTLTTLAVAPGEVVSAGTLIAELDSESEQVALDRAQLALREAEAALTRSQELRNANAVSVVQLSAAQLAADQARLEVRNAELALERRSIRSPIAGTVGLIQVSQGNLVAAQTAVTTVEDNATIRLDFWVPERYSGAIAIGQPVSVSSVALPGQTFSGVVRAIDNRIDTTSRTLQVQASIDNPDRRIRPGMSLSVTLDFPGDTYTMVDPLSLQWSAEGAYVWTYAEGVVNRASVEIVERNSNGVLVIGEIAEGQQVVTEGVLQLQPGASVRLLDDLAAGAPARPAARS
ncbi:RND family efflux transporter, MFP subunit [Devosia enhydra]|uniref:RND family efflux transporter, MFP subunit n=1 Tax=Devosia enhydra TaxID=665118 RepID=A0A1K2I1M7_9HYPH|nr:efflux RND transporter periplasmic adaptor subunit [Devosia enhydra]SFZ86298.1 RND family efflux transporter, MFP subunit [Devosia enhydra]